MLESEKKRYQEKLDKMTDVGLLDELFIVYNLARNGWRNEYYYLDCEKLVRKEIINRMRSK